MQPMSYLNHFSIVDSRQNSGRVRKTEVAFPRKTKKTPQKMQPKVMAAAKMMTNVATKKEGIN
jgi:hypothetical protein